MTKANYEILREMVNYCRTNNIYWFCELYEHAENRKEWLRVIMSKDGCRMLSAYLASKAKKDGVICDGEFHRQIDEILSDD